jgi:2-dehydro-3-deoxyphosphogluconate aldolase / (4S)-4-hydroxy-2-oxoglutarate aldolase
MKKNEVRSRIAEIGIVPVLQASSLEEARFATAALAEGGIPIVEFTILGPHAIEILRELVRSSPNVLVGAGALRDGESSRRALDASAEFLVTPDIGLETIKLGLEEDKFVMAGALTPSEVLTAWKAGCDFVKIFPCAQVGGPQYIRALRGPFPDIPLVPTGGVNLNTAGDFIQAGAAAVGVGAELIMKQALKSRAHDVIRDLARRFVSVVNEARSNMPHPSPSKREPRHRETREARS